MHDTSLPTWDAEHTARIPVAVYTGDALHRQELSARTTRGATRSPATCKACR
jgi:hypothetical protein